MSSITITITTELLYQMAGQMTSNMLTHLIAAQDAKTFANYVNEEIQRELITRGLIFKTGEITPIGAVLINWFYDGEIPFIFPEMLKITS